MRSGRPELDERRGAPDRPDLGAQEMTMITVFRPSTIVTLGLSAALLAGCGGGDRDREAAGSAETARGGQERLTATGCLSVNPESQLYVLTTSPDPMVGTTGGVIAKTPTTITYQLADGAGLENHVGQEIEVTGWVDQEAAQTESMEEERTEAPRNLPESEARVETTTETRIRVVPMQVESFRLVSNQCTEADDSPEAPQPPEPPRPPRPQP
jgi:hypothetical protein